MNKLIEIDREDYGPFAKYIDDMDVTDIEWNGYMFTVTDLKKGKYKVADHGMTPQFIEVFSQMVGNSMNEQFNQTNPKVVADTEDFRIVMVYNSISRGGTTISLRRITAVRRITNESILETGYCNAEILSLLINCIKVKFNITIGGSPGVGKSELQKYLTQYIGDMERSITIEEFNDMKYMELNPNKDCISFIVNKNFTYNDAIRLAVKLNAKWIHIPEVSGPEFNSMQNAYTTGLKGSTTIHFNDVYGLVDRAVSMSGDVRDEERFTNAIYEWFDVVLLVSKRPAMPGQEDFYDYETAPRYIDQVCVYARENKENKIYMIMDRGEMVSTQLPAYMLEKMNRYGVEDPFACKEVSQMLQEGKNEKEKEPA